MAEHVEVVWTEDSDGEKDKELQKVSFDKQICYYSSFKNKVFASPHYRQSLLELRKRAEREKALDDTTLLNAVRAHYPFVYRINDGIGTTNTILQKVCEERGWREFKEMPFGTPYEKAMKGATGWNLWWSYNLYQFSPYKYLRHWQFTNHNPKGFQFCNKLYLCNYLRKMKNIHGGIFEFYPTSFILPEESTKLRTEHFKRAQHYSINNYNNLLPLRESVKMTPRTPPPPSTAVNRRKGRSQVYTSNKPPSTAPVQAPVEEGPERFCPIWISKPVGQSQGKGIFLTTDLTSIATDKKSVLQEYICRPHLIGGYKWDIRIYVCVAAIDPLVIYIYQEGLCRFATEKYDTSDLTAMYSHLTNASLNKLSAGYEKDKDVIGPGCKWSLRKLRQHFRDTHMPDWFMWQKVMAMVVLTVIGDSLRLGYSASNRNCFDLFGFDVLVDQHMNPWLLECNYSPGLGGDCEIDEIVKKPMLHDLFNLLGFPDRKSQKDANNNVVPSTSEESRPDEEVDRPFYNDASRQYVHMLLHKIANADSIDKRRRDTEWQPDYMYTSAARLLDAKAIYSQNLVVQYLKNQSNGKVSKHVKDMIVSLATKKLKKGEKTEKRKSKSTSNLSPPTPVETLRSSMIQSAHQIEEYVNTLPLRGTSSPQLGQSAKVPQIPLKNTSFPHPDSEAFQKLKHYFDAGVDYPLDLKTGKFKDCPALITVKKDWFNPPKQQGQWIRVYPFDARTTKSPYKSSLTDLRIAVRSVENYMKLAEDLFKTCPYESDEFYKRRLNVMCRRETEMWTPPTVWTTPNSGNESDSDHSDMSVSDDLETGTQSLDN